MSFVQNETWFYWVQLFGVGILSFSSVGILGKIATKWTHSHIYIRHQTLRSQAEHQLIALNQAADSVGVPRIDRDMGPYQMAIAGAFIALSVAKEAHQPDSPSNAKQEKK